MTGKRDLNATELSPWWTHGVVIIGLAFVILSWWTSIP